MYGMKACQRAVRYVLAAWIMVFNCFDAIGANNKTCNSGFWYGPYPDRGECVLQPDRGACYSKFQVDGQSD